MNGSHVGGSRLRSLLSAGILLFSLLACQTPLQERRWLIMETENFQLITDYDEATAIQRANEFETFHRFLGALVKLDGFKSSIPTRVHMFASQASYRSFGPAFTGGYFTGTARANYIATGQVKGVPGTAIPFHEYSHYLVRSRQLFGYPVWFDEGHAELVSTTKIKDGTLAFGAPPLDRIETLSRFGGMPLKRLLTARDVANWNPEESARFYAMSWAFVHYLYFSDDAKKDKLWQKKDVYLQLVNEGISEEDAFTRAFGGTFIQMDKRLYDYITGKLKIFTLPAEQFAPQQPPRLRVASTAEASEWLAELALNSRNVLGAAQLLEAAQASEPDRPASLALLGLTRFQQGRSEEAEPLLTRAIQLAPDAAETHYAYGLYLAGHALFRDDANVVRPTTLPDALRRVYLDRARREYRRAIELAPRRPESYVALAFTYLYPEEPAGEAIGYADKAFELLPSAPDVVIQLAELLIASRRGDEALPLLRRLRPAAARSSSYTLYLDALIRQAEGQANMPAVSAPPTAP